MTLDEEIDAGNDYREDRVILYGGQSYLSLKHLHEDMKIDMNISNFAAKYRNNVAYKNKEHAIAIAVSLTTKCKNARSLADRIIRGHDKIDKALLTKWII
tara:strand:- start:3437 stop:3736 length:300 start_codon:yes stop_codon:yes gene_type:complete